MREWASNVFVSVSRRAGKTRIRRFTLTAMVQVVIEAVPDDTSLMGLSTLAWWHGGVLTRCETHEDGERTFRRAVDGPEASKIVASMLHDAAVARRDSRLDPT